MGQHGMWPRLGQVDLLPPGDSGLKGRVSHGSEPWREGRDSHEDRSRYNFPKETLASFSATWPLQTWDFCLNLSLLLNSIVALKSFCGSPPAYKTPNRDNLAYASKAAFQFYLQSHASTLIFSGGDF